MYRVVHRQSRGSRELIQTIQGSMESIRVLILACGAQFGPQTDTFYLKNIEII